MTPEERQMLTDLANKVAQTPAPPVDKEAEDFIRTRIGSRPDALYLMTQTVLIQNMALDQAKQQIQQLQQSSQAPAAPSSSSFLGTQGAPRSSGYAPPQQGYSAPQPPPPTYQAVPVSSGSSGSSGAGGSGSFLKGAAQTAAGVAAGALAFEGIRSLFESHSGGGFFGGGGVGGYGAPVEETVNNYYDSPEQQASDDRDYREDSSQNDDASQDYDDTSDTSDDYSDDDGSGGDFLT